MTKKFKIILHFSTDEDFDEYLEALMDEPIGRYYTSESLEFEDIPCKKEIYFDGGSSPDDIGSIAVYVTDNEGMYINHFISKDYGQMTNNEAEYHAFIKACEFAGEGDHLKGDSLLVVNQLNGTYRVKSPNLLSLYYKASLLMKDKKLKVSWIRRSENYAGKMLEKIKG